MSKMNISTTEIMDKDIKFDYTKWQQNLFEDMTLDEVNEEAAAFSKTNPL